MKAAGTKSPTWEARTLHDLRVAARLLKTLRAGGDVRSRKARRLRGAVRANRYENDLKFAIAIDRLISEL